MPKLLLLQLIVPICLTLGFIPHMAHATPLSTPVPDATAFAGRDSIIKKYFEIRGLNITFEILPLNSYVALQKKHDLKAMAARRRGAQKQFLKLAQAFRDSKTEHIPPPALFQGLRTGGQPSNLAAITITGLEEVRR